MIRWSSFGLVLLTAYSAPIAAADPGFQAEVKVEKPTRLDWEFVTGTFGADAVTLPTDYLSYRQRFQLFVPSDYDAKKAWPLVVFLSPGDDPLGWRSWQKVCEERGVFFCAAYGAGNNQRIGTRLRIVLDQFDEVHGIIASIQTKLISRDWAKVDTWPVRWRWLCRSCAAAWS